MSARKIELDGETLDIAQVVSVAREGTLVSLSPKAKTKVETAAALVQEWTKSGEVIYGVTTGFGPFSEVVISSDKIRKIQYNLIISHAAGVGPPLPVEVVRAAMLLRANTLAKGHSGIRLSTLQLLIDLLNKRVHPIIPEKGSVGASGDLAPLSHMVLVLLGEGEAKYKGKILPGAEALKQAGLEPIQLEAKEGIALINGTQIMTAIAALALADAKILLGSAEIAAALSIEALEGVLDAFDKRIHKLRPHPGQCQTAQNLSALLTGSKQVLTSQQRATEAQKAIKRFSDTLPQGSQENREALESILRETLNTVIAIDQQIPVEPAKSVKQLQNKRNHIKKHLETMGISNKTFEAALKMARTTRRVQDAYSLRCTPQVLGAARDAVEYAKRIITIEMNSATDNPLIFPTTKAFLSGGNFHGQPIAQAMDALSIAIASIGSIAERRIARLIDSKLNNGLPLLLVHPKLADRGVYFGLGLAHITAASLLAESQTLCTPASVNSIPTAANQEDHVSMGTISARQTREIIDNVEHIVAIELLCATQGIDIRGLFKPITLGKGSQIAFDIIRTGVPRYTDQESPGGDRLSHDFLVHADIQRIWELIHMHQLVDPIRTRVKGFQL